MPNKEHLRLWVEDLESGQHQQIKGHMANLQVDGSYGYCCLGRLCEVALANDVPIVRRQRQHTAGGHELTYDDCAGSFVPDSVAVWTGVSSNALSYYAGDNDRGDSFETIARAIKRHYRLGDA